MEIQEIKSRLTITEVLGHYGLKPTTSGSLHCPFHQSKKGSKRKKTLQVYTDTNRYQCFHADCKAGNGDVIDFIEQMERCTKHQAIEKAKTFITGTIAPPDGPVSQDAHSDSNRHNVVKAVSSRRSNAKVTVSGKHQPGETQKVPQGSSGAGVFNVLSSEQMHYQDEHLDITVLGGIRLEGLDRMRCTLKITSVQKPTVPGSRRASIRHTLDLYNDDQLQKLVRKTAERLELGTSKIEPALYALTDHLEAYRLQQLEQRKEDKPAIQPLSEEERSQAEAFLKSEGLMERTNELLGESGIVGESINRQILWLVYSSRKRPRPLHVICLGASGTGKTYLQEKVSRFVPEHEKFTFTASTENAFYYLEPYDLCHKVVIIEDMDGVQYLLYPLRELQTKQWISKLVPLKDNPHSTTSKTRKIEVFGPICLSGTTTKERIYEDNANRCLLLHLDNSVQQQEAIMDYQRKLSAGKINSDQEQQAASLLLNIQRVLEPVKVINPYAESLRIPARCFKPLRTNEHYLQFIETVTWFHQYQREEKADPDTGEVYIETTLEDIQIANHLMKEALLTKSDELPRSIRDFFEQLKGWLRKNNQTSFYSKAMRTHFRLYPMKANRYIKTLEQFGYLKRIGGNKKAGYEYEVADWEDYNRLKEGVNVLDQLLNELPKG